MVSSWPVTDPGAVFEVEGLAFEVHGEKWQYREKLYIALHKPSGYECSRKPSHHPGVMTLLPDKTPESKGNYVNITAFE